MLITSLQDWAMEMTLTFPDQITTLKAQTPCSEWLTQLDWLLVDQHTHKKKLGIKAWHLIDLGEISQERKLS